MGQDCGPSGDEGSSDSLAQGFGALAGSGFGEVGLGFFCISPWTEQLATHQFQFAARKLHAGNLGYQGLGIGLRQVLQQIGGTSILTLVPLANVDWTSIKKMG